MSENVNKFSNDDKTKYASEIENISYALVIENNPYTSEPENTLTYYENEDIEGFPSLTCHEKIKLINKRRKLILEEKKDTQEIINITKQPMPTRDVNRLSELLDKNGLKLVTNDFKELTKAEKRVIRMDYWGVTTKPDDSILSNFYKKACMKADADKMNGNAAKNKTYNKEKHETLTFKYDLSKSPSWQLFHQFKNFRKIEGRLQKQLHSLKISQKQLEKMSVEDFTDVIFREFPKNEEGYNAQIFLGAKCSFIKDFIKKFEKPFTKILKSIDLDERYIKELVKNMKSNGICEGFNVYDENGVKIDDIKTIKLSVHHKVAVNDANSKSHLAQINLFENLCLCIDDPYHTKILHARALERIYQDKEGKTKRDSLKFNNNDIVFVAGLCHLQQLFYDYANDERTKNAIECERYDGPFISNDIDGVSSKKEKNKKTNKYEHGNDKAEKTLIKTIASIEELKKYMKVSAR